MRLLISEYNPVKFYEFLYETETGRNTRFMDLVNVEESIMSFQDERQWSQPWQKSDEIKIQIQSDSAGLRLCILDCGENEIISSDFLPKVTNWKESGFEVYEASLVLENVEEGRYYIALKDDEDIYLISDKIYIKEYLENSIYLQYHHRKNKGDLAFDTGISFNLRVLSVLQEFQPGSDDAVYLDQYRNTTVLSSTPFRIYKMIIGDAFGVPDYLADKVNRILGISSVLFDDIQFAKAEGSKMERNGERKYPFAGWAIDVVEAINKDAILFDVDPLKRSSTVFGYNDGVYEDIGDETLLN